MLRTAGSSMRWITIRAGNFKYQKNLGSFMPADSSEGREGKGEREHKVKKAAGSTSRGKNEKSAVRISEESREKRERRIREDAGERREERTEEQNRGRSEDRTEEGKRERSRDRTGERNKERSEERTEDESREKNGEHTEERNKERSEECTEEGKRERSREGTEERNKEKSEERTEEENWEKSRDRTGEGNRERSEDRAGGGDRERSEDRTGEEKEEKSEKKSFGETSVEREASSLFPRWHPASRDWNICSITILSLLVILGFFLVFMDILRNFMLVAFFGTFLTFLGVISGYFFLQSYKLKNYMAVYLRHKRNAQEFIDMLIVSIPDENDGATEEMKCISGHTFGLLSSAMTMKLKSGEIIEVNKLHISSVGVFGLYLLVKAPLDSDIWSILSPLMKR